MATERQIAGRIDWKQFGLEHRGRVGQTREASVFGNDLTPHTKTYHFEGLTAEQSASLASTIVGGALELVRDGYHVTRDVRDDIVVLKWQKRAKRAGSEEANAILGR